MERSRNGSGMIRGLRQVHRLLTLAEIHHPLRRSGCRIVRMMRVDIFIHLLLDVVLEVHQRKWSVAGIFLRNILRFNGYDDSCIGPSGVAGGVGHSVQHGGALFGGGRHEYASRAHAE